jgi:hypothetical protein
MLWKVVIMMVYVPVEFTMIAIEMIRAKHYFEKIAF